MTELKAIAPAAIRGESNRSGEGVQHAHCNRDTEHVVDKGAEQVLVHIAHGGARDLHRRDHTAQAALDQRDIAGFDRHVGTGTDRHSDIGLGERRGIVDTVTDHGDDPTLELQLLNLVRFLLWQDIGQHAFNADAFAQWR